MHGQSNGILRFSEFEKLCAFHSVLVLACNLKIQVFYVHDSLSPAHGSPTALLL